MKKIDKLAAILKKLNIEGATEENRKIALELVADINPLELSMAEQKLIEEGMKPEDLRHLCDIHMEVLKDELEKLRAQVEEGHVLHTLIIEHDEILKFLSELDEANIYIQKMDSYKEDPIFNKLGELAENLLGAEPHHKREEDVLFIAMENRQITGPTRIMRMEHDDLRERKHTIKELAEKVSEMDFAEFKEKLDEAAKYIVFHLRDHIFKENYILYPTAMESITEKEAWEKMKDDCDKVGYCTFTPNK